MFPLKSLEIVVNDSLSNVDNFFSVFHQTYNSFVRNLFETLIVG